jgi:hypothetical protein
MGGQLAGDVESNHPLHLPITNPLERSPHTRTGPRPSTGGVGPTTGPYKYKEETLTDPNLDKSSRRLDIVYPTNGQ